MMSFPMDHQQKAVVKMIKAPSILVVSLGFAPLRMPAAADEAADTGNWA